MSGVLWIAAYLAAGALLAVADARKLGWRGRLGPFLLILTAWLPVILYGSWVAWRDRDLLRERERDRIE